MRTIRHGATALVTSILLLTSCGQGSEEGSGEGAKGPETAGASEQAVPAGAAEGGEEEALTLAAIDELLAKGELQVAVERIAAERDEEALEPELAIRMIQALWRLDEVPRAVRVARATLERHPDATAVSSALASIYISLEQNAMAVDTLRAARENGATDGEVALTLGVCLGRMEDLEGARAEFERAAAAGAPQTDVDYNMAVLLIGEKRHAEAEELLAAVVAAQPEHLDARRELARMQLSHRPDEEGRREAALSHLNAVLDQREDDWRAYELMGDASMAIGDPVAAVAFYTESLRYGQNPPRVEDKYRAAAQARNEALAEEGLIEAPQDEGRKSGPPLPAGLEERWQQARKERSEKDQEGGDDAPQDQGE